MARNPKSAGRKAPDAMRQALFALLQGKREINPGPREEINERHGVAGVTILRHVFDNLARAKCSPRSEILAHVPGWLGLSPEERMKAAALVLRVLDECHAETWWELLWCLAIDAVVPHKKGRKSKWLGLEGIMFVLEVDIELHAMGPNRTKKALDKAIAAVKAANPRYAHFSAATLRAAYYEALPNRIACFPEGKFASGETVLAQGIVCDIAPDEVEVEFVFYGVRQRLWLPRDLIAGVRPRSFTPADFGGVSTPPPYVPEERSREIRKNNPTRKALLSNGTQSGNSEQ